MHPSVTWPVVFLAETSVRSRRKLLKLFWIGMSQKTFYLIGKKEAPHLTLGNVRYYSCYYTRNGLKVSQDCMRLRNEIHQCPWLPSDRECFGKLAGTASISRWHECWSTGGMKVEWMLINTRCYAWGITIPSSHWTLKRLSIPEAGLGWLYPKRNKSKV